MRPLTKWNQVIDRAEDLPRAVRAAFRHMTTGRPGAAHLGLPYDVQRQPTDADDIWAVAAHGRYPAWRTAPDPAAVEAAAEIVLAARRPVFVCGGGVVIAGAEAALQTRAEALGAPVATTISGQGSIADDHPLAVGVVGSNGGTPETRDIVGAADCVVFVSCRAGSVTTERWRHPDPKGGARIDHIDDDPAVIGASYEPDAALVGDARLALEALVAAVGRHSPPRPDDGARALVAAAKRRKFAAFRALAESDARPIRPERLVAALQAVLPREATLVADPGTPCPYLSAYFEWSAPGRHFISNRAHGALGYAMGAAIGAHFGRPDRKTVAVMGDGSFAMAAGEMETLVRRRLPITLVVVSNATFGWIKAGQKSGYEGRYYSVDFGRTDHAAVARGFGLKAWSVRDPADLVPALRAAVESEGPTLVDVETQPLHEARAPVSEWVA